MAKIGTEKKKKSVLSFIGNALITLVFIVALVAIGFSVYCRLSGTSPSVFGYRAYIVMTESMTPEINPNELIIAQEIDKKDLKVGDDIVFVSQSSQTKGMVIVHRIIEINPDGSFTTQGINNEQPDSEKVTNTIGKVIFSSAILGALPALFVRYPLVAFPIVAGIILIVLISQFVSSVKKINEDEEKEENLLAHKAREMAREEVFVKFYDADDPFDTDE